MRTNDLSPARLALYLREAWSNVLGAPLLTLVAVLTIAVSLILVGFFGTLLVNANHVLDAMAQDLRITVYFGFQKLESVKPIHDIEDIKRRAQIVSLCIHERQESSQFVDEIPYTYALSDLAPLPTSPANLDACLRSPALSI